MSGNASRERCPSKIVAPLVNLGGENALPNGGHHIKVRRGKCPGKDPDRKSCTQGCRELLSKRCLEQGQR